MCADVKPNTRPSQTAMTTIAGRLPRANRCRFAGRLLRHAARTPTNTERCTVSKPKDTTVQYRTPANTSSLSWTIFALNLMASRRVHRPRDRVGRPVVPTSSNASVLPPTAPNVFLLLARSVGPTLPHSGRVSLRVLLSPIPLLVKG